MDIVNPFRVVVHIGSQTFLLLWINQPASIIRAPNWNHLFILMYSKTSIARTRIIRIPDRSDTFADSKFRCFAILNSYYCCGGYFYKQESPEVRIKFALRAIQTCKNSPHDFELSKLNCIRDTGGLNLRLASVKTALNKYFQNVSLTHTIRDTHLSVLQTAWLLEQGLHKLDLLC